MERYTSGWYYAALLLCLPLLKGCVAAPLVVAGAQVVGASLELDQVVTIDTADMDPQIPSALAQSDSLAIISGETVFSGANTTVWREIADYLDSTPNYEVSIFDAGGKLTNSQLRKMSGDICQKERGLDLVLTAKLDALEADFTNSLKYFVIGRQDYDWTGDFLMYRCRDGWTARLPFEANMNKGVWADTEDEILRDLGIAFGIQVERLAALKSDVSPARRVGVPSRGDVAEAQELLNALGYDVGAADGLSGPRTEAAIAEFQRDNGLSTTGEVDFRLLEALREARLR